MIQPGVVRMAIDLQADGTAYAQTEGALTVETDQEPDTLITRVVWFTLDEARIRSMLTAAGADPEAVDGAIMALEAAAMATEAHRDRSDDEGEIVYWRPELVKVVTDHQRLWPDDPKRDGCSCGRLRIGDSFAEHIADEYEMEARG
jgi:hypothetical protein